MLSEQDKRSLKAALAKRDKARLKLESADQEFSHKLLLTYKSSGCTLAELGEVVGVSRQRIHQILTGR